MFYQKQVLAGLLRFLLRTFFKTVGEPPHPKFILSSATVHPKLIFPDSLKKAFMVPEDRSYQKQYFAKIFSNPLALMLEIHFYLYFLGISFECALNNHSSQKSNL